jgi:hypothetical protein
MQGYKAFVRINFVRHAMSMMTTRLPSHPRMPLFLLNDL